MGLMGVIRDYLLDRKLFSAFGVFPKPNQTEPSSAQEFNLLKAIGKPIPKSLNFIIRQSKVPLYVRILGRDDP